ncbi:hypothetical protein AAF712_006753 [Marasmius tenuissimus]|uniref:Uncharacterized protein n=1 Tax=Marasmius tenuissimus TaxID=585030 RepID=A0ABR2ZZB1_9AGAR
MTKALGELNAAEYNISEGSLACDRPKARLPTIHPPRIRPNEENGETQINSPAHLTQAIDQGNEETLFVIANNVRRSN